MIPNEHSYCDLDPDAVDQWGIPVLRFHWQWDDNEIRMAKDMQETFRQIVEAGGGTYVSRAGLDPTRPYGIADGGVIIHNEDADFAGQLKIAELAAVKAANGDLFIPLGLIGHGSGSAHTLLLSCRSEVPARGFRQSIGAYYKKRSQEV